MFTIHFKNQIYLLNSLEELQDFVSKVHPNLEGSYSVLESKEEQQNALSSDELKAREEFQLLAESNIIFSHQNQKNPVFNQEELVFGDVQLNPAQTIEEYNSIFLIKGGYVQKGFEKEEKWQDHFEKFQQAIREMVAFEKEFRVQKEEAKDFTEKAKNVIFDLLPLLASLREKYLEQKKVLEIQASIRETHFVQCIGCKKSPILGTRYHCTICEDFNFCEKCEENQEHMHPFAKLKRRDQQHFLHQSQNDILYSAVSLKKESTATDFDDLLRIDLTKSIIKKDVEEEKTDEKKNYISSPKVITDQKILHKEEDKISSEDFKEIGEVNRIHKEKSGKNDNGQGKEEEKIEEKVKVLKEVFGGEREVLVSFVRENNDLEMDPLCEKYLTLFFNYI